MHSRRLPDPEPTMDFSEAKELLNACFREELKDEAFGDAEVFWSMNGGSVANGYFNSSLAEIWFPNENLFVRGPMADELRYYGTEIVTSRNDKRERDGFIEDNTRPRHIKKRVSATTKSKVSKG